MTGVKLIDSKIELQFIICGHYATSTPPLIKTLAGEPGLGTHKSKDHAGGISYLVCSATKGIKGKKFKLINGKIMYSIDQTCCPASIIFNPGGLYN